MALTKTSFSMIKGEMLNILDFIPSNITTSTTDCTAYFQAAIDAAAGSKTLFIPAGDYLIEDALFLPPYISIVGDTERDGPILQFKPSSAKTLFTPKNGPNSGSFYTGIELKNLVLISDTSTSGNLNRAIYSNQFAYNDISNIQIFNFGYGIDLIGSVNNKFDRCLIQNCSEYLVKYLGNQSTSDVWTQCTFRDSVYGVLSTGANSGIRFTNCLFENLEEVGVDISKESYSWSFTDSYAENVPNGSAGSPDQCMFRFGYTGTTTVSIQAAQIIGGAYKGNTSGAAGYMIDSYACTGFTVLGVNASLFDNPINIDATTKDGSVIINGLTVSGTVNTTTPITGTFASKVYGLLPGNQLSATTPVQNGYFNSVVTSSIAGAVSTLRVSSSYLSLGPDAGGGAVHPFYDGTTNLGLAANKWGTVFAATGTIDTSDERQKQDIRDLSAAESAVAVRLKELVKAYRFKSAYEEKGDDARIHVGVIAQDVKAAFEAEGLDPMRYGVVCYDQWDDVVDEDGNITLHAGDSYGVRYDELWAFIISTL